MTRARRVVVVAVTLLAGLASLAGCSHAPARTATVTGHLYAAGGPPPGTPYPVPGTISAANARGTFTVKVAGDGRYSLPLPPGTYTITGTSPSVTSNNSPVACYPAGGGTVTVYADQTRTTNVYCPLK